MDNAQILDEYFNDPDTQPYLKALSIDRSSSELTIMQPKSKASFSDWIDRIGVIVFFLCLAMGFALCCGCNDPIDLAPTPEPIVLHTTVMNDEEPILAHEIALKTLSDNEPIPPVPDPPTPQPPSPQPDLIIHIGDKCPKCDHGWVDGDHDGKPDYKCQACGGDGVADKGDPIVTQESVVTPTAPPSMALANLCTKGDLEGVERGVKTVSKDLISLTNIVDGKMDEMKKGWEAEREYVANTMTQISKAMGVRNKKINNHLKTVDETLSTLTDRITTIENKITPPTPEPKPEPQPTPSVLQTLPIKEALPTTPPAAVTPTPTGPIQVSYRIVFHNKYLYWDPSTKNFTDQEGTEKVNGNLIPDIAVQGQIRICDGTSCKMYPIEKVPAQ